MRRARPADALAEESRGRVGGSVWRCAANRSVPVTDSTTHNTTPAGGSAVASTVTSAGPTTKIISSTTDSSANAECSAGEPSSSALQRARTIDPSEGIEDPAAQPEIIRTQVGRRSSAQVTNTTLLTANTATSGRSTRC